MDIKALLLLAGGFYLLTQGKKSSSSSTSVTKPKGFVYNCNSLKVMNKEQTGNELFEIGKSVIKDLGIDSSNIFMVDPIKYIKAFISKINASCIKSPSVMNYQEKILFYMVGYSSLDVLDYIFAIPDFSTEKYPNIIPFGFDCEILNIEGDIKTNYNKCKFVVDSQNPDYKKWISIQKTFPGILINYLELQGKEGELDAALQYMGATGHYP